MDKDPEAKALEEGYSLPPSKKLHVPGVRPEPRPVANNVDAKKQLFEKLNLYHAAGLNDMGGVLDYQSYELDRAEEDL